MDWRISARKDGFRIVRRLLSDLGKRACAAQDAMNSDAVSEGPPSSSKGPISYSPVAFLKTIPILGKRRELIYA